MTEQISEQGTAGIELLTVREAAKLLKIHEAAVRRAIRKGELEASRIGRLWRIRMEGIQDFLERNKARCGSDTGSF